MSHKRRKRSLCSCEIYWLQVAFEMCHRQHQKKKKKKSCVWQFSCSQSVQLGAADLEASWQTSCATLNGLAQEELLYIASQPKQTSALAVYLQRDARYAWVYQQFTTFYQMLDVR